MVRAFCLMIFSNSRIYASGGVAVSGEAVGGAQAAEELRWEVSPAGPGVLRATYIPTLAGPLRIVTRLDGKAVR